VAVLRGEKSAQKLAAAAEDAYGDAGAQQGGESLGSDLHCLGHDEAVQVTNGDFAQDFVALGGLIAPEDFEALALQGDPAAVLINGGSGQG
jgi:hypothetical protein